MAATKTINFLPEIFQTETNKKFLNATLDQLISEPNFKKVNGYIGRKFAPTFKTTDSYISEIDSSRQNYQLEPSTVIVDPETDSVNFYSSYVDLINKIKFYGGNVDNHSRLFSNEVYSFDGKFDFDKFINFSQYYWIENGPDAVTVSASGVPTEYTWDVTIDSTTGAYNFASKAGADNNPNITLAYGGKYTFNIKAGEFWIQAKAGTSGFDKDHPNINVRQVLGVTNNGSTAGSVQFIVPQPNGQSRFTDMPLAQSVDYATTINYRDINGATSADFISQFGGFDNVAAAVNGKRIIFVGSDIDDYFWTSALTNNDIVLKADRTKTWQVQVDQNTDIITLVPAEIVDKNNRVYIKSGNANASKNFYLDYTGFYKEVPLLTAPLKTLYYQNSLSGLSAGIISLVDPAQAVIDPAVEIIGQKSYISPTGVVFTNGLRVRFDTTATGRYANNDYYVEGVGTSIRLVPVSALVAPELPNLSAQDYLTVNRSSLNLNAWSRSNRWFHVDVLRATAAYNNTDLVLNQTLRASRSIIEFNADVQLFNYGCVAKSPIDIFDTSITSAYTQVENKGTNNATTLTITTAGSTVVLTHGDRVIFSNDSNPAIRSKIYVFQIVNISENINTQQYIGNIVESDDSTISAGNNLLVLSGAYSSQEIWYDGTTWHTAQQKLAANQAPLFDIYDENGISFGDTNYYVNSSFAGTKLFSYKPGTGAMDPVLGFPLSYRTFNNVGDIQYENNFDVDTFTYLVNPSTKTANINSGYLHVTTSINTFDVENIWTKTTEQSKQYQLIHHTADGTNNLFEIDILPDPSADVPNVKVLVNSRAIDLNNFGLTQIGARYAVLINPSLIVAGDSVDLLIYSSSVSKLGHYQVPSNLDNNSLNSNFTSLTLGQIRNHLITLSYNSQSVTGEVPGNNNLRDINIKNNGGSILKHASPVVYSSLFLVDSNMNFVESLRYAQKEYAKFKNKILELATQTEIDINDISKSLDTIIGTINSVKNSNFPWYHSDMVPWGNDKTTLPPYTVLDPRIREYELTKIFNDKQLSNQAVLVYLTRTVNGVTTKELMVNGRDYIFNSDRPTITVPASFNLNFNDIITIVEYNNTDGNYIPETPSKMGMWSKYIPSIYLDDTYASGPTMVMQGHDGSITPVFGDYRDDILLEFERRIYNNIKQDLTQSVVAAGAQFPGRFRISDYSLTEFNQVLSSNFLSWVGNNRLDYTTNTYFQSNNPWTWNYKNFKDALTGEYLPGTWRAIFDYFYDTDRPHTHPWEMLGFVNKPDYWEARYGAAPYTGGNLVLWTDLSLGYIHAGDRAGIYAEFARPGLLNIIPVDDNGNLRSPDQFAVLDFDSSKANSSYAVGDYGPVETAWRRSSDYPFVLMQTLALLKPAYFFANFANIDRYTFNYNVNQFLVMPGNQHLTSASLEVNGAVDSSGTIQRTSGYINWISDYLKNLGIGDPQTKIKSSLKNLNVQLSYKAAGFTDKRYINLLAEQGSPNSTSDSIIIPNDNYRVELFKSVPINKIAYSAVIVEKSQNGYTVSGYNLSSPFFTIVPSLSNNNAYKIKAGNATGVIYKDYQKVRVRVPYGFEFKTTQAVVDFLVSYQRQLQSQGFIFTDYDSELSAKQDWILSAKEFLTWAQQGWQVGNVIILSPVNQSLSAKLTNSVVDEITNLPTGSKIMDPNFSVIKSSAFSVVREDNNFSISTTKGQTIAFAELHLVQYEHVLIFDNKTSFNDIIYSPDTGNRQFRLKLIGSKTADWTGALNPAGFIYNNSTVDEWQQGKDYKKGDLVSYKNNYYVALDKVVATDLFDIKKWKQIAQSSIKTGLLPNFATNAAKFENIYDIDNQPVDGELNFYSNGITGFRERQYLTDLALSVETQSKFYQGYIKQKGTKNAVLALAQAQLANISNEITITEEWALRVGEYGATDSDRFVELELDEAVITNNPSPVQLLETTGTPTAGVAHYFPSEVYQSSLNHVPNMFGDFVPTADDIVFPTAGYVNIDDVDDTIFDIANFAELGNVLNKIGTGYTIWAAKGFSGDWDVYRVSETECAVTSLAYSINNYAVVSTSTVHNMSVGDIVAIRRFDSRFDGFYQIYAINGINSFTIGLRQNYKLLSQLQTVSSNGILFKLVSGRIASPSAVDSHTPANGWVQNDKVWVDTLDAAGNWGVYNKTSPWAAATKIYLNSSEYQGQDNFGQSVKISSDGKTMYAGAPNSGTGRAAIFLKTTAGEWLENSNFVVGSTDTLGFGQVVDASDKSFIVAAPRSSSNIGYVFVYTVNVATGISMGQIITVPGGQANDLFGASVAVSQTGNWLYIGAPGAGKVYAYGLLTDTTAIQTLTATGSNNDFVLTNQTITDPSELLVNGSVPYVPNIDYTIVNVGGTNKLRFLVNGSTTAPAAGPILVTVHTRYKLIDTWTQGNGFGISVACNPAGDQIAIGANTATVGGVANAGKGYVYDRMVEGFYANGSNNTFIPVRPIGSTRRVTANNVEQIAGIDYNIIGNNVQFTTAPTAGTLISIETNQFNLIQTLTSSTATDGQRFGTKAVISPDTTKIYFSAPYYNLPYYRSGAVYTFANQGRLYGSIIGTVASPTVTPGHSIRINTVEVQFTSNTLAHVISKINGAGIPGITASSSNGHLQIVAARVTSFNNIGVLTKSNKLDVLPGSGTTLAPGTGTALVDLGLTIFVQTQTITHPKSNENEFFGSAMAISDNATTLAIGSVGAQTINGTTFDSTDTTFDVGSINFKDAIANSGAVYVYDLMDNPFESVDNPALFAYVQQLQAPALDDNFNFGASIDIAGNYIVAGAINDYSITARGGSIYAFENTLGTQGWDLIRVDSTRVEPNSIDKLYIYNKKSQNITARLDYFDPVKGKLLGIAQQDIDFASEDDPAIYNDGTGIDTGTTSKFSTTFHWTNTQVGKTWWDTSQMRFIDYEQSDILYRSKHWGDMFPGSVVKVYEWVESKVLPSQYVANGGNGTPKDTANGSFVSYTFVDPATGLFSTLYYFWVSDKTTVDVIKTNRTNSVSSIQQILKSPKDQGIPYAAALAKNAISLYNVNSFLSGTDAVLHIDYSPSTSSNIIHSEYQLVEEGSDATPIPDRIVAKLQDSLAGLDRAGLVVPDPKLTAVAQVGIEIRPRQTMFVNRLTALENFVKFVNGIFAQHPIVDSRDISELAASAPIPAANTGAWDKKIATRVELDYIVTSALPDGYKILIESDSNNDGLWAIFKWTASTQSWFLVQIQSFATSIYWSKIDWYASDFDFTVTPTYTIDHYYQLNQLTLAVGDIIKLNDNGEGRFVYYRVASDLSLAQVGIQNGTIALSSSIYDLAGGNMAFDNDNFDTVRFDQNPNQEVRHIFDSVFNDIFTKEIKVEFNNLFFGLVNYIFSEQKSADWIFKTSFIRVLHKIRDLVQYPSYVKDNQTFYEDYINEVKPYRTQIREYVPLYRGTDYLHAGATDFDLPPYFDTVSSTFRSPDGTYTTDATTLTTSNYADWNKNHSYSVVEIDIANGGTGYTLTPNVEISGGNGSGVVAHATINVTYGNIASVTIVNPGAGFTTPPVVTVNGNGTGAILVPRLKNVFYKPTPSNSYNTVRTFDTTIKFDRTNFSSNVVDWAPNTAYTATITTGTGTGNVWLASGSLVTYNNVIYKPVAANANTHATFDSSLYEVVAAGNTLIRANDRVMGYYTPGLGMPARDVSLLIDGIDYPGVQVTGVKFNNFTSNVNVGANIAFFSANSSIVSTNPLVDFVELGYNLNQQITVIGSTRNNKVFGIVNVTANTMIVDTALVSNESAGANVTLRYLDYADNSKIDSSIQSSYLDSALGTRPEDINIDGGAYVDPNSSHAPEELVPGRVYDTLSMTVFTKIAGNTITLGHRVFQSMTGQVQYYRIADATTTTLSANLLLNDSNVHVTNASVLPAPNPAQGHPGVVFINGEKITYYTIDTVNNVLGQIRRGVDGTGAPLVHTSGSRVVDSSMQQVIPGATSTESWLNMTANVADGTGFDGSTTNEVAFLKASPSYTP
jgi:hypothetical protein